MSNDAIFQEADVQAHKLLALLEEGLKLMPSEKVSKRTLASGQTFYKGMYLPLEAVSHKYLENYEYPFLYGYIPMFKRILQEAKSFSNEFSFRTLLEMGVENSYILFHPQVTAEEKKLYVITLILADYSSIETAMQGFFNGWFKKLYEENKTFLQSKLGEKDMKTVEDMYAVITENKQDEVVYTRLLKKARKLHNDMKSNILSTHEQRKQIQPSLAYKRIISGEAHTLHGNAFLILNRMGQQSLDNHLFRVYFYLGLSGKHLLQHLSIYLKNDTFTEKVTQYIEDDKPFNQKLAAAWGKSKS